VGLWKNCGRTFWTNHEIGKEKKRERRTEGIGENRFNQWEDPSDGRVRIRVSGEADNKVHGEQSDSGTQKFAGSREFQWRVTRRAGQFIGACQDEGARRFGEAKRAGAIPHGGCLLS
jgi:hypothetical protein